jgi:hypothetical protein
MVLSTAPPAAKARSDRDRSTILEREKEQRKRRPSARSLSFINDNDATYILVHALL